MNSKYITTPIYYASGNPHLGHTYTTVLADTFARYYRLRGINTRFITGTDEHGLKIERLANKQEKTPQAFVDDLAINFKNTWDNMDIKVDDFIRTTEKRHEEVAKEVWNTMIEKGDVYLGHYEGLYCIDCEQYYTEGELLEDGTCPIHRKKVERMKEESYFFRLSKYADCLLDYIETHPDFIVPETRRNEVIGFLKHNELKDLSISRTSFKWGIPVPNDEKHIMYVWIDALTSYLSTLGGLNSKEFEQYWSNTIHFIGKDILRFHTIYWPCFLFSLGIELPKTLVVHGWWTILDRKISKSDPATKIDPNQLIEDISVDGLRYFLLKELILGKDGNLDYTNLIASLNSSLANNVGNLVNRTINMINKYLDGAVPQIASDTLEAVDLEIKEGAYKMVKEVEEAMDSFNPAAALTATMAYSDLLNGYLDKTLPWKLAKEEGARQRLDEIFAYLIEGIRWLEVVLSPFIPHICEDIRKQCSFENTLEWPVTFELTRRQVSSEPTAIFKRISKDEEEKLIGKWRR